MGTVNSYEVFNENVTLVGGVKTSAEIENIPNNGFSVGIAANQGGGTEDLEATISLEGWRVTTGWAPEPLAVFETDFHPAGSAIDKCDGFGSAFAEKYRFVITPTGGVDGQVVLSVGQ